MRWNLARVKMLMLWVLPQCTKAWGTQEKQVALHRTKAVATPPKQEDSPWSRPHSGGSLVPPPPRMALKLNAEVCF